MWLIFTSRTIADAVIKSITATPTGVWVWSDPDNPGWDEAVIDEETGEESVIHHDPVNQVQQSVSVDGRVAINHTWSESDLEWLREYCSDDLIEFVAVLPVDW